MHARARSSGGSQFTSWLAASSRTVQRPIAAIVAAASDELDSARVVSPSGAFNRFAHSRPIFSCVLLAEQAKLKAILAPQVMMSGAV